MDVQVISHFIPWPVPLFILAITLFCISTIAVMTRRRRNFPPGPRGVPLLGNIFDVPKINPWLVYQEWSRKYGLSFLILRGLS